MTTLVLQPDATAGLDARMYSGNPTYNFGASILLHAGKTGGAPLLRSLLQFDVSIIPSHATIASAVLTLYCVGEDSATDYDVSAHRALTQWYEGAKDGAAPDPAQDGSTWNERNANGSVAWAGGAGGGSGSDYTAAATDAQTITGTGATFDWDVLADVVAWVGGASNYGWWLIGNEGVARTWKSFASSDNATPANRPMLTIEYTIPSLPATYGLAPVRYQPILLHQSTGTAHKLPTDWLSVHYVSNVCATGWFDLQAKCNRLSPG